MSHIRFSTNILARLGEELNPSPEHGLIELVKNSYDADASYCVIELINIDGVGGSIIIQDDGLGMLPEDIANGWLVLGSSQKSSDKLTARGRVPAGNKGLGRLAALRLGRQVTMETVSAERLESKYSLEIDWSAFEKADLVDEVELKIESEIASSESSGTLIVLDHVRQKINRMQVKRLARAMILLADPFDVRQSSFLPKLIAPEYRDLEELVDRRYFSDAEFVLEAKLRSGKAEVLLSDWRGKILYSADHETLMGGESDRKFHAPDSDFKLWVFLLDKKTFSTRKVSISEVRAWLAEFGGVHLYYNDLRVSPYGDRGNDWLDLNLMRVRSPELRPSTNTSIGKISVADPTGVLVQKTDRSGFIENDSFIALKEFAHAALNWMTRRRLERREQQRQHARNEARTEREKAADDIYEAFKKAPEKERKQIEMAFESYRRADEKEIYNLKQEVQLYRTLSTAGITAAVFAHESANNPIKVISQSLDTVTRRLGGYGIPNFDRKIKPPLDRMKVSVESLKVLGNVTLSLVDYDKRRASRIDLHSVIDGVIRLFQPFIETRQTEIVTSYADGKPYFMGSVAAIESIFTNLFNNSLAAFEKAPPGRRLIVVATALEDESVKITVSDNGLGFSEVSERDIWLPGVTTTENGTGLGLTIVRDAIVDLGGQVKAIPNGEYGGAEIVVSIPVIGVED